MNNATDLEDVGGKGDGKVGLLLAQRCLGVVASLEDVTALGPEVPYRVVAKSESSPWW